MGIYILYQEIKAHYGFKILKYIVRMMNSFMHRFWLTIILIHNIQYAIFSFSRQQWIVLLKTMLLSFEWWLITLTLHKIFFSSRFITNMINWFLNAFDSLYDIFYDSLDLDILYALFKMFVNVNVKAVWTVIHIHEIYNFSSSF